MHPLAVTLLILAVAFFWRDDMEKKDRRDCHQYEFLDQSLAGRIGARPWIFNSGTTVDEHIFLFEKKADRCVFDKTKEDFVRIRIQGRFSEGLYDLRSPAGADYIIDTKNFQHGVPCFGCFCCGMLEITEIDSARHIMSGRLDARWLDGDQVNGAFTFSYCLNPIIKL